MGASKLAAFLAGATIGVSARQAALFEVGLRHALYLSTAMSLLAVVLSLLRGANVGPATHRSTPMAEEA
jgi:hypothetical protein